MNGSRIITIAGLLAGVVGIGVLWASGIVFPFYPPPGMLILTAGALFVALVRWRWAPLMGTALGLFIVVGFLASAGVDNLLGGQGAGASIGSAIQILGVVVAAVAGVAAAARPRARVVS